MFKDQFNIFQIKHSSFAQGENLLVHFLIASYFYFYLLKLCYFLVLHALEVTVEERWGKFVKIVIGD